MEDARSYNGCGGFLQQWKINCVLLLHGKDDKLCINKSWKIMMATSDYLTLTLHTKNLDQHTSHVRFYIRIVYLQCMTAWVRSIITLLLLIYPFPPPWKMPCMSDNLLWFDLITLSLVIFAWFLDSWDGLHAFHAI